MAARYNRARPLRRYRGLILRLIEGVAAGNYTLMRTYSYSVYYISFLLVDPDKSRMVGLLTEHVTPSDQSEFRIHSLFEFPDK